MANTPQSKKRVRRNARRELINKARKSRIRTFIKKVELAIAAGDRDAALNAFRAAEPEIMRGVAKGVLHRNTAARKVSRLALRLNRISA
ncbi:MAG: 30S ribosomal protein S20 [Rhodothalassiaceae bacterium]